jgi:hypothetical protein
MSEGGPAHHGVAINGSARVRLLCKFQPNSRTVFPDTGLVGSRSTMSWKDRARQRRGIPQKSSIVLPAWAPSLDVANPYSSR